MIASFRIFRSLQSFHFRIRVGGAFVSNIGTWVRHTVLLYTQAAMGVLALGTMAGALIAASCEKARFRAGHRSARRSRDFFW